MIKKLLASSAFLLLSTVIMRSTMFIMNIVAARVLSIEAFGGFMILRSMASMFDSIVSASIGNVAVKKISRIQQFQQRKALLSQYISSLLTINVVIALVISIFVLALSEEILTNFLLGDQSMKTPLHLSLFVLLATILSSMAKKINIGLLNYKEMALLSIVNLIVGLPMMWLLLEYYDLSGLIIGVAIYFFMDSFLKCRTFIRKQNIDLSVSVRDYKSTIGSKISRDLLLSVVISSVSFLMYRVLVTNKSGDFSDVAFFDAAYQWLAVIMLITGSTTSITLQMLSEKSDNQKNIFKNNLILNIVIVFLFSLIISYFSDEIMQLYGDSYREYSYLIYVLCATALFATIDSVYNKLFISNGNTKVIILHTVISSSASLVFVSLSGIVDLPFLLSITFLLYYFVFFMLDTAYIVYKKDRGSVFLH